MPTPTEPTPPTTPASDKTGWLRTLLVLGAFVVAGTAAGYLLSKRPSDVAGRDNASPASHTPAEQEEPNPPTLD